MADRFAGRTVLVCGVRFAGAAAARALLARGAHVLLTDRVEGPDVAPLREAGARFLGDPTSIPVGTDLVVTSPGLPPSHPLLTNALAAGLEVWGEVELAWRLRRPGAAPWLAVTGTNGKTTSVRMLESILRSNHERALAVGNVGVSIIEAVEQGDAWDVLACELSSFQLHWSSTVRPQAGALLNLAPDHLDWHGSMAAYAAEKAKIWNADVAVGNADDPAVAALLSGIGFTLGEPTIGQLGVVDGMLVDRAFGADLELLPTSEIRPAGAHNVANALAAAGLARAHGASVAAVADGLRSFVPDPHRNQPLGRRDSVMWVDDSKATNPHAAEASLRGYESVVWVAGGQLKGVDIDELVSRVTDRLRGVVLLGVDRGQIAAALRRHAPALPVIEVARTDDGAMTEVVRAAAGLARPGDVVLLAPAAASYDMFTGYPARGAAFAAAVEALPSPGPA